MRYQEPLSLVTAPEMPTSGTVIVALMYNDGVLIGSDSQATDTTTEVRWLVRKIEQVKNHPVVIGYSGSVGSAQRTTDRLAQLNLTKNMFDKSDSFLAALDKAFAEEYTSIRSRSHPPVMFLPNITTGRSARFGPRGGVHS
ncbi:MAG: hypothetical protein EXR65_02620 [Dehalococcoidia bacterium]|nr:hypothetical protein [Dehalococcoidia bacterium]